MALCQDARQALASDRKHALDEAGDQRRVPQLSATCIATGPAKPALIPAPTPATVTPLPPPTGIEWLAGQPINLLDWGLQRAANSIEAIRSIRVAYSLNGTPTEDVLDVDFSLAEIGRLKYIIQGAVLVKAPEALTETYCIAALRAWRQAVLKSNGDRPANTIDVWFSHAERNLTDRPKNLAESVVGNFEFKMTVNGPGAGAGQPSPISCTTPFAVEPAPPPPPLPAQIP